jgi:hypothetical protein
MYAVFAVVLVLIAWAAGTPVGRAVVVASVVFIAASAWSAFGWHRRIREQRPFEDVDP